MGRSLALKWLDVGGDTVHEFMKAADTIVAHSVRWTQLFLAVPHIAARVAPDNEEDAADFFFPAFFSYSDQRPPFALCIRRGGLLSVHTRRERRNRPGAQNPVIRPPLPADGSRRTTPALPEPDGDEEDELANDPPRVQHHQMPAKKTRKRRREETSEERQKRRENRARREPEPQGQEDEGQDGEERLPWTQRQALGPTGQTGLNVQVRAELQARYRAPDVLQPPQVLEAMKALERKRLTVESVLGEDYNARHYLLHQNEEPGKPAKARALTVMSDFFKHRYEFSRKLRDLKPDSSYGEIVRACGLGEFAEDPRSTRSDESDHGGDEVPD